MNDYYLSTIRIYRERNLKIFRMHDFHWAHYSKRILKLIDLYWEKQIGKQSPYSLSPIERKMVFKWVIKNVRTKIIAYYSKFGSKRTQATFGCPITDEAGLRY